jgi:hypothetical protein
MDDLKILHDSWGSPEAPSRDVTARARAGLLARAAESGAATRRFRPLAVGALALAIAVGVALADLGGGSDGEQKAVLPGLPTVPVASAAVLEQAAVAAETKPFTPPRDDQWIYTEDRFRSSEGGTDTHRSWRRADGRGMAWIDENGKLAFRPVDPPAQPGRPPSELPESYKDFAAMPTGSDALLRWAYAQAKNITGGGTNDDGDVYLLFNHMLRDHVLPPDLEAGIFRALKQIPGVKVETVEVFGEAALSLGLATSDWLHEELLLDPDTYAYRGERSTVIRDATINPLKAGNATGEVKKGSKVVVARVNVAIVDEPGQRR